MYILWIYTLQDHTAIYVIRTEINFDNNENDSIRHRTTEVIYVIVVVIIASIFAITITTIARLPFLLPRSDL